jgi:hypothetical protein
MDTHLLIGIAVMFGLIGSAASRNLLRVLKPQPRLVPVRSAARERTVGDSPR